MRLPIFYARIYVLLYNILFQLTAPTRINLHMYPPYCPSLAHWPNIKGRETSSDRNLRKGGILFLAAELVTSRAENFASSSLGVQL